MNTKIIEIGESADLMRLLKTPAEMLREGGIVAFPTETVYGLGANALDEKAVKKIFEAKGRPSDNPLIVHIASEEDMNNLVDDIPEMAKRLMEKFWPGPLTLIFNKEASVPDCVTAGLSTVAIRMPSHPVANALIKLSGVPVAAPSANLSGKPSPTNCEHVIHDLNSRVDAIVCGDTAKVGLESTVLDVTGETPVILRPGGVTYEEIVQTVGRCALDPALDKSLKKSVIPKAPGMKYTHYAPNADIYLFEGAAEKVTNHICALKEEYESKGHKVGVITCDEHLKFYTGNQVKSLGSLKNLETLAANLFSVLRAFDNTDVDVILSEAFPKVGIGQALMNRLLKAAGHRLEQV